MTSENFKNHTLFDKIEQLSQRLKDDESKENIDLENYSYFESVHHYISDRIKITIPILVQEAEMNALANEISAGLEQINNYLGNNNLGHITNATNNFNSALNRIRNFPLPFAKNDFNFSKALANFQSSLTQKYESLEEENSILKQEIVDLKEDLNNKTSQFVQDLNNNNEKLEKLDNLVDEKEDRIDNLTQDFQEKYDEIKESSKQKFDEDRDIFRKEIDEQKVTFRSEIDELKDGIDANTSELVNKLEDKLEEAKKIVNVVGNIGVTGNFQRIANEHKKAADAWRIVAIGFMAVLSGLFIYTIWDISHGQSFDWIKSLIRVVAAAALSYPATYASKESSRHRNLESFNRRNELELASIEPFIELLPEDKKQDIKEKLVEKYFGKNKLQTVASESKDDISVTGFEKIIRAISSVIKQ